MIDKIIEKKIMTLIKNTETKVWPRSNKWLHSKLMDVYFRIGVRYGYSSNNVKHKTLEIASISVVEKYRGQGIFTNLLKFLSTFKGYTVIVENVLEDRLDHFLKTKTNMSVDPRALLIKPRSYYQINDDIQKFKKNIQ